MSSACWILVLLLLAPVSALAEPLRSVRDAVLTRLLSDFEVLAEVETPVLAVRILRLRDEGECGSSLESCPQELVYVAVTNMGEVRDRRLYTLPKAHEWEFTDWKMVPRKQGDGELAVFEMRRKLVDTSGPIKKWIYRTYEVRVSPSRGSLEEVK